MKEIIITTANNQISAAVLEEGRLIELLDDAEREARLAGSIYKGKVHNIVEGIQAAFVDIGLTKNAFLYFGDAMGNRPKEGQEIIVQVMREPIGNKGARVTTQLTLPGRFVVLLPNSCEHLSISRKIEDMEEKQRLLDLGMKLKPLEAGLIIRTLADGVSEKELKEDIENLQQLSQDITYKIQDKAHKGLLYKSNDPYSRLLREIIDDDVEKIIIDDVEIADLLRKRLNEINSPVANRIWTDLQGNLFSRHQIPAEIRNALQPRVSLPSGGYLVIEKTEALTAIDINSGKYIGENSLDETMKNLNLEAADEISRQIRLRNLSGMIMLDFIGMKNDKDWDIVIKYLEEALMRDKVKCQVLGKTKLGLVEVTRKKEGQTLNARYAKECPHCQGKGWLPKL